MESSPAQIEMLKTMIREFLAAHPEHAKILLNYTPGINSGFNFRTNTLNLGTTDPAIVGHEFAHINNTANSPLYKKLLMLSQGMSNVSRNASIPIMLGLKTFTSPQTQRDVLSTLAGLSAASSAPLLQEEASASAQAIINAKDKLHAIQILLPAFKNHLLKSLGPVAMYNLGRYI